jgi:hypothetical protein
VCLPLYDERDQDKDKEHFRAKVDEGEWLTPFWLGCVLRVVISMVSGMRVCR